MWNYWYCRSWKKKKCGIEEEERTCWSLKSWLGFFLAESQVNVWQEFLFQMLSMIYYLILVKTYEMGRADFMLLVLQIKSSSPGRGSNVCGYFCEVFSQTTEKGLWGSTSSSFSGQFICTDTQTHINTHTQVHISEHSLSRVLHFSPTCQLATGLWETEITSQQTHCPQLDYYRAFDVHIFSLFIYKNYRDSIIGDERANVITETNYRTINNSNLQ
jgi:hypothetical protein